MAPASPLKVGLQVVRLHPSWDEDDLLQSISTLWRRLCTKAQEAGLITQEPTVSNGLVADNQQLLPLKKVFAETTLNFIGIRPPSAQGSCGVWIKPHSTNPLRWSIEFQLLSPKKPRQNKTVTNKAGQAMYLTSIRPRRTHEPGWYCPILDENAVMSVSEREELAELSGLKQIVLGGILNYMNVRIGKGRVEDRVVVPKKRKAAPEVEVRVGRVGTERVGAECRPRVKRRRLVRGSRETGAGRCCNGVDAVQGSKTELLNGMEVC